MCAVPARNASYGNPENCSIAGMTQSSGTRQVVALSGVIAGLLELHSVCPRTLGIHQRNEKVPAGRWGQKSLSIAPRTGIET